MITYWIEAHPINIAEPQWLDEGEVPIFKNVEFWFERHWYIKKGEDKYREDLTHPPENRVKEFVQHRGGISGKGCGEKQLRIVLQFDKFSGILVVDEVSERLIKATKELEATNKESKMEIKQNTEVSYAIARLNRSLQYGDDMKSSSLVCIQDAIRILKSVEDSLIEAGVRL